MEDQKSENRRVRSISATQFETNFRIDLKVFVSEGRDGHQIVERLDAQFRGDADSFWSVRFWIRNQKSEDPVTRIGSGDTQCFVSVRSIRETLQVSDSTALKHLQKDLGHQYFHLC
jgi:hypothetical protein